MERNKGGRASLRSASGWGRPVGGRCVAALIVLALLALPVLALPSSSAAAGGAAAGKGAPDFAAIDAYIEAEMRTSRVPGLALGIVRGERVVHLRGFGNADGGGRPVTPKTPFILASVSKSFTALAVMQLVEQGRVDLDTPVRRYLPWFRVADEAASGQITVRHLLHHTSGLPATAALGAMRDDDTGDGALEARVRALRTVRLAHPVGAAFEYTDPNYDVLGLIVQTVSGMPFEEYVRARIFAPLAMGNAFAAEGEAREHGLATGHRSWFGFPVPFDAPYSRGSLPSSYLIASAEDLTQFLSAQLNGGRYGGATILSPAGVAAMHAPAAREGEGEVHYGMGWEVRSRAGRSVVQHDGTNANFYADLLLEPEGRWGVVILANYDSLNLNGGRLQALSGGVLALLHDDAPPAVPMPHHPLFGTLTLAIAVMTVLLAAGIVRSAFTLRRWLTDPASRPGRGWRRWLAIGGPGVAYLAWGLLMLVALPAVTYPLAPVLLLVPDLGYLILLSGAGALGWAVLRTVLASLALGRVVGLLAHPPGVARESLRQPRMVE